MILMAKIYCIFLRETHIGNYCYNFKTTQMFLYQTSQQKMMFVLVQPPFFVRICQMIIGFTMKYALT